MKICILSYKLFTGGFTSSLLPLLHHLSKRNIQVDLMLFEKSDDITINIPNINVIYNNTPHRPFNKLKKIYYLLKTKNLIKEYFKRKFTSDGDIIYRYNVFYGQALTRIRVKEYPQRCDLSEYTCVVAWEENFTSYFLSENVIAKNKIGYIHPDYRLAKFNKNVDEFAYAGLDKIAFVSIATKNSFCEAIPSLAHKAICIPNSLIVDDILLKSKAGGDTFTKGTFDIISVCRLDNVSKALDRAARIVKRLKNDNLDFKWYFVGDGPSKVLLENLIAEKDIADRLILLLEKANPHPFTIKADLFVLQSYYEGKPMSVGEAMILETPVLISRFASADEQILDTVTGFIADNNEEAIYQKLKWIIQNPSCLAPIRETLSCIDKHLAFESIDLFLSFACDDSKNI